MSKLYALCGSVVLTAGEAESNVDAKDINIGLLAIVVYGVLFVKPGLAVAPKPKSICIAPSVAVV